MNTRRISWPLLRIKHLVELTVASCLQLAPQLAAVSDSSRLDIELLLCALLQKNRTWLFTWPDKCLTAEQQQTFEQYFARRLNGEPIAHILGQREFWSLPLFCDNSTLIPRPDTELLVEICLAIFAGDELQQVRAILDLGTGTGAIALALASEKSHWQLTGVDQSLAAVALAEKNRAHLGLTNVQLLRSDWFASVPAYKKYDAIVSNPPYIDPQDPHLDLGDVRFEPRSALVADNHGLADIETILAQAPEYLAANGWVLLEHGYDQGQAVRELFAHYGYGQVETRRDLGGNERVTLGQYAGK